MAGSGNSGINPELVISHKFPEVFDPFSLLGSHFCCLISLNLVTNLGLFGICRAYILTLKGTC